MKMDVSARHNKRGMRRGADVNELLCGSKGARSKCDAGERSAAKALCRSAKRDEELAAGGGQVRRQSRRRDPGGKNHITRRLPHERKKWGCGGKSFPHKAAQPGNQT